MKSFEAPDIDLVISVRQSENDSARSQDLSKLQVFGVLHDLATEHDFATELVEHLKPIHLRRRPVPLHALNTELPHWAALFT